ncbi:SNF2 family N-terminal domain-containing protein [Hypoxylon fragiforme]|uniref:SNF2 family N-terminal domain-containing protein n=1 Tax=Hypoxylon fragiforme TaxID=63214 RepID=UPI0020C68E12|nr:SNF2 family N-terminal domain-containing protein [Hypoxylon fragiforme]KAI2607184.1 SNF2 family N-terminal domain-containing protein [Hypoxylon fragiforme]
MPPPLFSPSASWLNRRSTRPEASGIKVDNKSIFGEPTSDQLASEAQLRAEYEQVQQKHCVQREKDRLARSSTSSYLHKNPNPSNLLPNISRDTSEQTESQLQLRDKQQQQQRQQRQQQLDEKRKQLEERKLRDLAERARLEQQARQQLRLRLQEQRQLQQLQQPQQQLQVQSQYRPIIKPEPDLKATDLSSFLLKIQDRFPGRPEIVDKFKKYMNLRVPARDLLPDITDLFRTARELVQEYTSAMDAIDKSRSRPLPLPSTLPPTPQSDALSHSGSANDNNNDAMEEAEVILQQLQGGAVNSHQKELTRLLSMPDIDIPPSERTNTPAGMKCTLMEHQKACLTWLVKQEKDDHKKGGILADTMGLGKTIQAIALILQHPSHNSANKTTLIVAPLSLLKQWEQEILTKVRPSHQLKTIIVHGATKRNMSPVKLQTYDVVLTTYGTIGWEHSHRRKAKALFLADRSHFYRVILDEAHNIKNKKTQISEAASRIKATYRLCMTGTPFMNKPEEIFPLIRFLQIKPYDVWPSFHSHIIRRLDDTSDRSQREGVRSEGMRRLQVLFRSMTLRRTKTSTIDGEPILKLPRLIKETVMVKMTEEEKKYYDALEQKQRLEVNKFLRAGTSMKAYTYIFVLLLRLRQACCHPHLISDHNIPDNVEATAEQMQSYALKLKEPVVERLKAQEDFGCPICKEKTKCPLILYPCGHLICSSCFEAAMMLAKAADSNAENNCPGLHCKGKIDPKKVIVFAIFLEAHKIKTLQSENGDDENEDSDESWDSSDDDVDARGNLKDFIASDSEEDEETDSEDDDDEDFMNEDSDSGDDEVEENTDVGPDSQVDEVEENKDMDAINQAAVVDDDHDYKGTASMDDLWEDVAEKKESAEGPLSSDKDSGSDSLESMLAAIDRAAATKRNADNSGTNDESLGKESSRSSRKRKLPRSYSAIAPGKKRRGDVRNNKIAQKKKVFTAVKTVKDKKKSKGKKKGFTSLADLKKASSTNTAAKEKYMKNLRQEWQPSAKTAKTMEILRSIKENKPGEKTLIFSLWTSFLDLLEIPIQDEGFQYRRYDGSMSQFQRDSAIQDFVNNPEIKIMMISLRAGNAGLNLTAASQVIIMEPFWNPYIEEQAIDRAHRFGQHREVTVYHMLVAGTVEDRIRELQEQKRNLVDEALSEAGAQGVGRLDREQLMGLFGFATS